MNSCLKIVPLPSAARRCGPIVSFPTGSELSSVVAHVGTVIGCDNELQMKPMISVAGQISPFYELMYTTQKFLMSKGNS
jgi:hypothetical protein